MAEEKLGRSLDALIEENRKKLSRPRATGPRASVAEHKAAAAVTVERGNGTIRALKGIQDQSNRGRAGYGSGLGVLKAGVQKRKAVQLADEMEVEEHFEEYGAPRARAPMGGRGSVRGGRGRGGRGGRIPPGDPEGQWSHDLFDEREMGPPRRMQMPGGAGASAQTQLLIENLDHTVTEADLKELFGTCGKVVSAKIKYDRSDRSEGTAIVIFAQHVDAQKAIKEYHGVMLDGRQMQVSFAPQLSGNAPMAMLSSGKVITRPGRGGAAAARPQAGPPGQRAFQQSLGAVTGGGGGMGGGGGGMGGEGMGRGMGGGRGRGRGGGRLRSGVQIMSREQLDADMDAMMQ